MSQKSTKFAELVEYFNPARRALHFESPTVEPAVQVTLNKGESNACYIIEYPDIPVDNYIHGAGTYVVGDVRMGHNNALEQQTRIVADGQPTKIGNNNLLQEMTIHISQLREGEVKIGNGNFCAHGATMHGSSIGDQNYFGPEVTILDDAHGGSRNFFVSGAVIDYATHLDNGKAYKANFIDQQNFRDPKVAIGPSDDEVVFVNRRTQDGITLKELFHDPEMKFMSGKIVMRTLSKMYATANSLGGTTLANPGKHPAMAYLVHHVFQMGSYYLDIAARLAQVSDEKTQKECSLLINAIEAIYNGAEYDEEIASAWIERKKISKKLNNQWHV
jgi:carbonic anhydrase/acetyltransferase-like protein (isoleucine patch superfamily)